MQSPLTHSVYLITFHWAQGQCFFVVAVCPHPHQTYLALPQDHQSDVIFY